MQCPLIREYILQSVHIYVYYTLFSIKGIKANNEPVGAHTRGSVNTALNLGQQGMISNPIYDGPLYETVGESKPHFDSLPKLTRATESCYVDTAVAQLLSPSPDTEETPPPLGGSSSEESGETRLSNGAAANSNTNTDEDYAIMKPVEPDDLI